MSDKTCVSKRRLFKIAKNKAQSNLREIKQKWWEMKATALQEAADKCDFKSFYENLKGVFGPTSNGSSPILSLDGTLLTDRNDIIKRWAQHFSNVLNRESIVNNEVIDSLPQRPVMEALSVNPTMPEVKKSHKATVQRKSSW